LRNIVSSVRKVADLNSEIAAASKEQSHGLEQINQAMTQLDQVTQTNAASAEQVASSAEEMSSQGLIMQETVSRLNALIHGVRAAKLLEEKAKAATHATFLASAIGTAKVLPMRSKAGAAEKVIPFGDDDKGNIGNTSGF
jgi:methyl-accepting chemotaxis protein